MIPEIITFAGSVVLSALTGYVMWQTFDNKSTINEKLQEVIIETPKDNETLFYDMIFDLLDSDFDSWKRKVHPATKPDSALRYSVYKTEYIHPSGISFVLSNMYLFGELSVDGSVKLDNKYVDPLKKAKQISKLIDKKVAEKNEKIRNNQYKKAAEKVIKYYEQINNSSD